MEIQECPVLHPSAKEFKNFHEFVEKVDRLYKKDFGMVKVVFFNSQTCSALFSSVFDYVGSTSSLVEIEVFGLCCSAIKFDD